MIRIATILAALLLTIAIFILDGWTPLGFAHGLLYVFPVLLLRNQPKALQVAVALLVTALTATGYILAPAGFTDAYVMLNRSLSVLVIAVIVMLQMRTRAAAS